MFKKKRTKKSINAAFQSGWVIVLKDCDANSDPNDRDYGFYHNATAWTARFLPLRGNQFLERESTVVDQEDGLGWVLCGGGGFVMLRL